MTAQNEGSVDQTQQYSIKWRCGTSSPCGNVAAQQVYYRAKIQASAQSFCKLETEFTVKLVGLPFPFWPSLALVGSVFATLLISTVTAVMLMERREQKKLMEMDAKMHMSESLFG